MMTTLKICPTCGKERYISDWETECYGCHEKKWFKSLVEDIDDGNADSIDNEDKVVCPDCGEAFKPEGYETDEYVDEYDTEVVCDECGKTFVVNAEVKITYSTKRKE
jgi:protein-arginine kinase activator protein McsA